MGNRRDQTHLAGQPMPRAGAEPPRSSGGSRCAVDGARTTREESATGNLPARDSALATHRAEEVSRACHPEETPRASVCRKVGVGRLTSRCGFSVRAPLSAGKSPRFTMTDSPAPRCPLSAGTAPPSPLLALVCEELEVPLAPRWPLQVRAPGRGALGFECLLAAQWVWTRSPVGYLTNTGSQKGRWHTWHSCLSEIRNELLFTFIWSCL